MSVEPLASAPIESRSKPNYHLIALGLLLLFHLCFNLWWLHADDHAVRSDEEDHMKMARVYYEVMFLNDYESPMKRLVAITTIPLGIPAHPPVLHILGACMMQCFGYSTDVMAATNTVLLLLTLLGCFCIARRFLNPWEAVGATAIISFIPLIFVGSRYFMTDYPTLLLTVWGFYAMLRSDRFEHHGWAFCFALLVGLGILARTMAFLYLIAPAFVLWLIGLLSSFSRKGVDWRSLKPLLLNTALILVVATGVFSPWYFHHLERFHHYWTQEHSGRGPLAVAPLAAKAPADSAEAPEGEAKAVAKKPGPSPAPGLIKQLQKPVIPWRRYPLYLVNSAVFLPLFLLALAGMVLAFLQQRFRTLDTLLILIWLLGSWAALTILLKHGAARYVLPALPPIGFFVTITVLSLPRRLPRYLGGAALALLLLFQFGNLSIHAYGKIAKTYIPITIEESTQRFYADPGVVVWRDNLCLGHSYAHLGAPEQNNFVDRLFMAIIRTEKARPFLSGEDATYVRLNLRGLEFTERHYWPAPNPYKRPGLKTEDLPRRRIRCVGMAMNTPALLKHLKTTDYVIYAVRAEESGKEAAWKAFLEERGYERVEHFSQPRRNYMEARHYGLFAKRMEGELVQIKEEADIQKLGLFDLYAFKHSPSFPQLSDDLKRFTENCFRQRLSRYTSPPIPLNDSVVFIGADIQPTEGNQYLFHFIFKVEKSIDKTWRIFLHGHVNEEDVTKLPERCHEMGYQDWNFWPVPPTREWQAGEYIILSHEIDAVAIPYFFALGLFDNRTNEFWGESASLGWIDFGEIQRQNPQQ